MFYSCKVDLPVTEGGRVEGSLTTNNQPFIFTHIVHGIVGNVADPESSGLADDGQYYVLWKDEIRSFGKEAILASLLFGPKVQGEWTRLPYAIYYAGNHTITFQLTNAYTRTLTPKADTFPVQFVLRGMADWGELQKQY